MGTRGAEPLAKPNPPRKAAHDGSPRAAPIYPKSRAMTTFTRFALVRRCFSTAVGWQEYSTFVDYADPTTLAQAEINARNMDWKESTTIALAPIF
jgi:hypothetical protein